MSKAEIAIALLVPLLWGIQFVVIKVGLAVFPPLFFVGLRFSAVAALLLPFAGWLKRHELVPIIGISIFIGGLNFALFFVGLAHASASLSSVVQQLSTPFTVLLAWPILRERPSVAVSLGVILAFAGVALTVAGPRSSEALAPLMPVVGGSCALAVGNVLTKRVGPFKPVKLMAWMSLFTVPQVWAASALLENGQIASLHHATPEAWLAFAYTVLFGAIAGFCLWFWLIGRLSVTQVAPFALLQTVFAIGAGVLCLEEPLTARLIAGALICMTGVTISQGRFRRLPASAPPDAPALAGRNQ